MADTTDPITGRRWSIHEVAGRLWDQIEDDEQEDDQR